MPSGSWRRSKKGLAPPDARRRGLSRAPPRDLRPAVCPLCRRRPGGPVRARDRRGRRPPADPVRPGRRRTAGPGPRRGRAWSSSAAWPSGIDSLAHWGALESGPDGGRAGVGAGRGLPQGKQGALPEDRRDGRRRHRVPAGRPAAGLSLPAPEQDHQRADARRRWSSRPPGGAARSSPRGSSLEQNRDVMAVPGSLTSDLSRRDQLADQNRRQACRNMGRCGRRDCRLRSGRGCCPRKTGAAKRCPTLSPEEKKIFDRLNVGRTHPYRRARRDDRRFRFRGAWRRLLNLELKGLVRQAPGKCFQRSLVDATSHSSSWNRPPRPTPSTATWARAMSSRRRWGISGTCPRASSGSGRRPRFRAPLCRHPGPEKDRGRAPEGRQGIGPPSSWRPTPTGRERPSAGT